MKIGKIAKLCKQMHDIMIVNDERENGQRVQWVGTRREIYPLYGFPILDEKTVFYAFDIDKNKKGDFIYTEMSAGECALNIGERDATEREIREETYHITLMNSTYTPIDTSKGMRFINREYMQPLVSASDMLHLAERRTKGGVIYIVARLGLFVAGVIAPRVITVQEEIQPFLDLAERVEFARQCTEADKTIFVKVESETGEIMEGYGE